jgi:ribokinase
VKRILIVGSLNADLVQPLTRMPRRGETVLAGEIKVVPGGKGANQAVAAGRLRGEVTMVGEVGQDHFGDLLIESLNSAGVDGTRIGRSPGATGTACILVLPDGENLIVVSPAANGKLTSETVRTRLQQMPAGELSTEWIVLCQLEIPLSATALALATAHRAGAVTILDPAPAQALDRDILSCVSYLTPNQTEAAFLLGSEDLIQTYAEAEQAARRLVAMGPQAVVLKLGPLGCVIADARNCFRVPGFTVDAIDTTAAGDTFNGAFAVALGEGLAASEAARFAHAAAALSVTRFGAQSSIPGRPEVDAFLAAHSRSLGEC